MSKILILVFIASAIILVFVALDYRKQEDVPVTTSQNASGYDGWGTDFEKALENAKLSKKHILVLFTGSDWCQPCKELKKIVFNKDMFKDFAKDNFELVVVDFPDQFKLPESQRIQNDKLAEKFDIEGYPTVVFLTSEGKEIKRGNFIAETPQEFIAYFEKYAKNPIAP